MAAKSKCLFTFDKSTESRNIYKNMYPLRSG